MLVRDIMLDTYSIYSDTTDLEETPSPSLSGRSTRSRDKSEQRKNSVEKQTKYDGQRVLSLVDYLKAIFRQESFIIFLENGDSSDLIFTSYSDRSADVGETILA